MNLGRLLYKGEIFTQVNNSLITKWILLEDLKSRIRVQNKSIRINDTFLIYLNLPY
jgi:hypothetical protein